MKKLFTLLAILCCTVAAMAQFSQAPAFPGAEGYGRYVSGGRGGTIYHVTNLKDSGTGSLRAAVEASGSRTVIFDVSGTIDLSSELKIKNGNLSILGQTAPGQGICVKGYPVTVSASNVIIRYIRCRMGDIYAQEADAVGGRNNANIIIDHCSFSWSTDECASFYANSNFTMQWCYITEALRNSVHDKGQHGYGGIWGGQRASFHHNMLAHNDSRNTRLDHDYVSSAAIEPIDYVNNVIYNWGGNNTYGGESKGKGGDHYRKINFVGNYYKPGPATGESSKNWIYNMTNKCSNCDSSDPTNIEPAHLYLTGNIMEGNDAINADNWTGIHPDITISDFTPYKSSTKYTATGYEYNTISLQDAHTAYEKVLAYGGASYGRDAIDTRIVREATNGTYTYNGSNGSTGGLIDTQSDVGGWCSLIGGTKPTDTDGDGMPDEWETLNGLNPNDASDGNTKTIDTKGYYTNCEVYFNSLVEKTIKAQRADATETFEEYYPAAKYYEEVTVITPVAEGTVTYGLVSDMEGKSAISDYTGQASSDIADYIDEASADCGDILGYQSSTFCGTDGNYMLALIDGSKASGSDPEVKADGTGDSSVSFNIVAIDDDNNYQLRVTGIDFYAAKDGTNADATLSADLNGNSIVSSATLPRMNNGGSLINAAYHCSLSGITPDPAGTNTLNIAYTGGAGGKTLGLSDVKLNVEVVTVTKERHVVDPTGIKEVKTAVNPTTKKTVKVFRNGQIMIGNYNILGQRVR